MFMLETCFNDRRIITLLLGIWTLLCATVFCVIMQEDKSPFLSFGPNEHSRLLGVALNTWPKWWCVAIYTFFSTGIAAFSSDSVEPFILNTIQDHKTVYIPYSKFTCLIIIQVFTCYAVVVTIIGLFVALTQVDFTLIRLASDLIVNYITTTYFLRGKVVDPYKYDAWLRGSQTVSQNTSQHEILDDDLELSVLDTINETDNMLDNTKKNTSTEEHRTDRA
jgi:hypothetical protein